MASPDVFLSSPARRAARFVNLVRSSSPELPSVDEMLLQKPKGPAIRSGSKATPIPDDATTSFTSAREIWRSAQVSQRNNPSPAQAQDSEVVIEEIDSSPPEPLLPAAKILEVPDLDLPIVADQPVQESPTAAHNAAQPWKKYMPRTPEKDATQTSPHWKSPSPTIPTPQFLPGPSDQVATEKSSKSPPTSKNANDDYIPGQPLMLETAVTRRKDWTPPQQRVQVIKDSDSSDGEGEAEAAPPVDDDKNMVNSFGNMVSAYRCEGTPTPEADSQVQKKRKIAEPKGNTVSTKPAPKPKAPRKKPRTITDLATSAYKRAPQAGTDELNEQNDVPTPAEEPVVATAKPKAKPRKRQSKAKKPPPPKPVLFSPETALRQVARQDFVFGTSSQLATEKSPTLLRDLQAAMKSSNQMDCYELATPTNSDGIEPPELRAKLWAAAARNEDGDLFDVQVIDMAGGSSPLPRRTGTDDPFGYVRADVHTAAEGATVDQGDSFVDISEVIRAPQADKMAGDPKQIEMIKDTEMDGSQSLNQEEQVVVTGTADEAAPTKPTYESYTDAQLLREVTKYGFKPIKRRATMISLLEKCWRQMSGASVQQARMSSTAAGSQSNEATGGESSTTARSNDKRPCGKSKQPSKEPESSTTQLPPPSAQLPETPKRKRGRPKKNAQAGLENSQASRTVTSKGGAVARTKSAKVVEIPDSDSEAANLQSSPYSSVEQTFSPPQPVDLATSMGEDTELSLTMTPNDDEATLFTQITKAVKTAPRSTDPTNPSWHEKMLLYDPIVLEDLTAWLNSGQLTRVGHDGEVNPGQIKRWCESKSICCLWKVNLRGQERKRF